MKKLITHPDNLKHFKDVFEDDSSPENLFVSMQVITEQHMDRERPTGRWIVPGGKAVARDDVRIPWGRFAEWGPEDLPFLQRMGMVRPQMEPLFYLMDDKLLLDLLTAPLPMTMTWNTF